MKVKTLVVGPLEENCYVCYDEESRQAIIFDPGAEPHTILEFIKSEALTVEKIVNTHGHFDHIGAVTKIKETLGVKFYMHEEDRPWLEPPLRDMHSMGNNISVTMDGTIRGGEIIEACGTQFEVIHTPGHTKGGCVFYFPKENIAITGDTLFKGTVGRTDFPGGDFHDMITSVKSRLSTLSDECVIYPGHGPKSTMGFERVHNPYLR